MPSLNEDAKSFISTLPASYRDDVSQEAMIQHAKLATQRRGPLALGAFEKNATTTAICIVADDRPGLLALISEAIVRCGFDVLNAEAFTRRVGDGAEAVDLFWLRRLENDKSLPLDDGDVERLRVTLLDLLESSLPPSRGMPAQRQGVSTSASRVRFIEDEDGALSTLEIETEDRSGLLLAVSRALFAQRVQVLRCEVRTESSRRVVDRFKIAEQDGSPVEQARRLQIQVEVLNAIEPAKRLHSSAPPPELRE